MRVYNKLDVARNVWAAVMRKYGQRLRKQVDDVSIGAYVSGREQGYTVTVHFKGLRGARNTVQFSENRNSDDIVIYPGDTTDPSVPEAEQDAIYKAARYICPGDYDTAAKAVALALGLI